MKAILGAVLIDGNGGPPLSDSVVVIGGGRILAAGPRSSITVPSEASAIDGSGKTIMPAPIDICPQPEPPAALHPTSPGDARAQVAAIARAGRRGPLFMDELSRPVAQALLEAARAAQIPVLARVRSQADARFLVSNGASGFLGMIRDTEALDPDFVARLRDLRIVFAPALARSGPDLAIAQRNTLRLFRSGVLIAAASEGAGIQHEMELMAAAGIPPSDVIVAATHNSALALGELDRTGTVQPGKRAALLLAAASPAEDIRNLRQAVPLPQP